MEYTEYMETLKEQIQNKRARSLVAEEIRGHIEEQTKELLTGSLAEAVKTGQIVYRTVDISDKEGEKIADRYEVTWSSLFVNRWKDGQEQRNNMTEFAFSKATSDPEGFKAGLKEKIEILMK